MHLTVQRWAAAILGAAVLVSPRVGTACVGDCNGDAAVTIDELTRGVLVALGEAPLSTCDAIDNNRDGSVTVDELVLAVSKALDGCALGPAGAVLLSTQGQELDQYDLASGSVATTVPNTRGKLVGTPCLLPGGAGNLVVGDQTDAVHGWSVFSPDGTFLAPVPALPPLPLESSAQGSGPVHCAVDAGDLLFGVAVQTPGGNDGQLWVAFPPDYHQSCLLDATLRSPGAIAAGPDDALYVPESVPGGSVLRIPGPFPDDFNHCAAAVGGPPLLPKSVFIASTDGSIPTAVAQESTNGDWFVAALGGNDGSLPGMREYDEVGASVRQVFTPGTGGNPTALAFDRQGTLYYADGGTAGTAGSGTLRTIRFAARDGMPGPPELVASGLNSPDGLAVVPSRADEWLTLGGGLRRTFFDPFAQQFTATTVTQLTLKWRYQTSGMINAQAAVVWLDLPTEGRTQVVIVPSWDQHVYALRAANGSRVWQYAMKPQPGTFYPYSASPTIAWIGGQPRVYVPGGETMYCLDALTGAEIWHFDAGTGCTDCTPAEERNEIESTPAIVNGLVIGAMDVNDDTPGNGGMFALRADDGRLVWWFDLFTQSTCTPAPADNIRQFDGYHTAAQLGLPADFLTTRPGCNFDRTGWGCGNVWSSPAVDLRRGLIYTDSANCDTSTDPSKGEPPPPPPPFEEAIFALHLDGTPAWHWRPREVDDQDFDFGAVPNLFEAMIGGQMRDVVGVGGKDGTYYVLDRDGVNAITGKVEPYWSTNVVPGGSAGGLIGSASVGEGVVAFCTAPGESVFEPQKPLVHTLDAATGQIVWENSDVSTCFGPSMGAPGLTFTGGTPIPKINIFKRDDGTVLEGVLASTVPSGISAGPTIVGNLMVVGGGTGAHNSGSDAEGEAVRDTPLSAFCITGTPGCTALACTDGNPCTYDYLNQNGTCISEPSADGLDCPLGQTDGTCQAGTCVAATPAPPPTPGG